MNARAIGVVVLVVALAGGLVARTIVPDQFNTVAIVLAAVVAGVARFVLFAGNKTPPDAGGIPTARSGLSGAGPSGEPPSGGDPDPIGRLREMLKGAGLSKYAGDIERHVLPSIRMQAHPADEGSSDIGRSRIGGLPDLPPGTPWPEWKGSPLSFICQINLSDVAPCDAEKSLPESGILYLFYDAEQGVWGFDPKDLGGSKVMYFDGDPSDLAPVAKPPQLPDEAVFKPLDVDFSCELTYPGWESIYIQRMGMTRDEQFAYGDVVESLQGSDEDHPISRMLGHPDPVQGEMQLECQLVTHGLYCGDETGYKDPRRTELEKGATDWLLLLQIDSHEDAGMMWGDMGRLYVWIPETALRMRDFEKAWLILQCG